MSNSEPRLTAGAVRLVLAALEAPLARLSPAVVKRRAADVAPLVKAGIIKPGGHEPITTASDDFSDAPVSLSWNQDRGCFGYFSGVQGWREVSNQQVTFYDIDISRFLRTLTHKCDIAGKVEE